MKQILRKKYIIISILGVLLLTNYYGLPVYAEEEQLNESKIHFINIPGNNDAILLESEGKFAMIDSGEDTDYPDGSDFRYPLRPGVVIDGGSEQQVIAYMKEVGVTQENFEFYLGTHAHSDHIGAADEIIREFLPEKVYLSRYDDSYIQKNRGLWDNQYVHDNAVIAAYETGAVLVQYFDGSYPADTYQYIERNMPVSEKVVRKSDEQYDYETALDKRDEGKVYQGKGIYAPYSAMGEADEKKKDVLEQALHSAQTGSTKLTLGSMQLELFNYEGNWDEEPIYDANRMSLCVKVTQGNHTVFLGGDLDREGEKAIVDQVGNIDFMKASHHGFTGSNSLEFMEKISPQITIITGNYTEEIERNYEKLNSLDYRIYTTSQYKNMVGAIVIKLRDLTTNVRDFAPFLTKTIYSPYTLYQDGRAVGAEGITTVSGDLYFFNDSPYAEVEKWNQNNGKMYYSGKNGKLVKGWVLHGNDWYYTNEDYVMQTGNQIIDGVAYYFDEKTGELVDGKTPGWHAMNGKWYYYDNAGNRVTGWLAWNDSWFYLDEHGAATGWKHLDGERYYFDINGYMQTDWQYIEGKWYYFADSGEMLTGWNWIRTAWYYLDTNGEMLTGWNFINGNWYYMYENGDMLTDWQYIDGNWYCFAGSGEMLTGWNWIRTAWYYLDTNGEMLTSWNFINGNWYYMHGNGVMLTGWQYIDGNWYYLAGSGEMLTGWNWVKTAWYYLEENGKMITGWKTLDGQKYYLRTSGEMSISWQYIDGSWYYFANNGTMLTGWQYIDTNWYYLKSDGVMVNTTQIIDGKVYYFNSLGQWIG